MVQIEHVTIVYLIPVVVAALRWGAIPALFAAISGVAAAAFFFYAPFYDFRVHSPDQIADIVLFMTVATITGRVGVAVRQAKMRAQAESLRDALIGSVSHELRTPLASIVGSASILAQSPAIGRDEHLSSLVRVVWAKPNGSTATSRICSTRRASAATEFGRTGMGRSRGHRQWRARAQAAPAWRPSDRARCRRRFTVDLY